ncbi:hypothetical protein F5Y09DRAFT_296554 [Xylaria sp. FL1042]|nr:hypothetical protein F5Y09DRAFT_296554 [Xylaria sp. FL1042]
MTIPFLCQRCSARLPRSSFRLLRLNKSPLHTKVIPAEPPYDAVILPTLPESSRSQYPDAIIKENNGDGSPALLAALVPSQGQGDETNNTTLRWTGVIRKFIPRRTPVVEQLASLPLANTARELKAKILSARGDYVLFREDLSALYGLSHQEARHAVGQLERLLWGHQDIEVAAQQLDQYLAWKKDFAAVLQNLVSASSVLEDTPSISDAKPETPSHGNVLASMRSAWQRLDEARRQRLWPQIVLSVADSEPHILSNLIQFTFEPSWSPSYVIEDMLYILFRRRQLALQKGAHDDSQRIQQEITGITTFVLSKCPPRYLALEQSVLCSTFPSLSTSELIRRYELLKIIEHPLHVNTLLHVASRLAKGYNTKKYAVDILRVLTSMTGFDINSPAAASVCTSLLTLNESEPLPDEQAAPDLLFEFLLKQGFSPNLLVFSALMRNFCIRGHLDTAWKIFDLMLQRGLEPDHHVYSILLNGSKHDLDSTALGHIFNIITSRSAWAPVLLNDFLGFLFQENESQMEQRRRQRKKVNNAWRPMVELYAKFYDLAPLQKFVFFPLENLLGTTRVPKYSAPSIRMAESLMPQPDHMIMQPDSITLSLMIGAHMRSLNTPKYAIRYYISFFNLVNRQDPTALSIVTNHGTLMFDIFLRTFLQFRETIGFAIEQVQKSIDAAKREKARHGRNLHHPPPSIYTWTILLNGLKNHNDTRGAVAVFDMMTNIGAVQPTLPTWNALIQAFARAGNVNGVVKAIWSLEKAGFQPDDQTIKAVSMLPKPLKEQAIVQLEEIRKAPGDFSNMKAPSRDSATNSGVPKAKESQFSSSDPIQRPRPVIAKTLSALAQQHERLDLAMIDPGSGKRQAIRQSRVWIGQSSLPSEPLHDYTVNVPLEV